MSRGLLSGAALIVAAILTVALNVIAANGFRSARLDLTADSLYALNPGSRNVLATLEEPVTLRFYFSERVANQTPQLKRYGQRVREMLEQYALIAEGKIRLEVIDPEPFTDQEDDAVRNGLGTVPITVDENLYFGLVGTNTVDDREVISFFQSGKEAFLEYDLTRLIYNLSEPRKPKVGLITAHQMNQDVSPLLTFGGRGPQQWVIVSQLRAVFELETIDLAAATIGEDIDVLLLVHPPRLSPEMSYAIDQFVLGGGRALVMVDPFSEVGAAFSNQQRQAGGALVPESSKLDKLFAAWGVELAVDQFVGDWNYAQRVNVGGMGGAKAVRYLSWLALRPATYDRDDVIMAGLGPIVVASAGSLSKREGATTEFKPLIRSSAESMLFASSFLRSGPKPRNLIANFKATEDRYVMAARISGMVKSAFPDGRPKPKDEAEAKPEGSSEGEGEAKADEKPADAPHIAESKTPINLVIVADGDMVFDQFWVREQNMLGQRLFVQTSANADFLINALDHLAGSQDLISLRSRGKSERRFEVLAALRREAEKAFLDQERALAEKLGATRKRLVELQGKTRPGAGGGSLISKKQQEEIGKAQVVIRQTRRELRDVQHDLNKDIDRLETRLKFANIGAVPVLIGLLALGLAATRAARRRRNVAGRRD